jgi:hypothetical protein
MEKMDLSESRFNVKRGPFLFWLVLVAALLLPGPVPATGQTESSADAEANIADCVDFESLTLGDQYTYGDVFVESGATIQVKEFFFANGTSTTGGYTQVGNAGLAGGSGLELQVNNVNLAFNFGHPLTGLSFLFGEYGGNLNIEINGDFRNFDNFASINGLTIGGVTVAVTNGLGNDTGMVQLTGTVNSFAVGGQELWIDQLCLQGECVDFEDLAVNTQYNFGDTFADSGADVEVKEFYFSDGTPFTGGFAEVENGGLAGGSGLELQVNNVTLAFDFGQVLPGLSMDFGEYGGNLNIEINNDFRNFDDFTDLNGQTVGGAQVVVINGLGNDQGRLYLFGGIASFAVGGQELWIDNLCPLGDCLQFEGLPSGQIYLVGDTFFELAVQVEVAEFTWSNGIVYAGGQAQVVSTGLAGGAGQELAVNNVNLDFNFGNSAKSISLLFGEYGGNLNIEVNGDFRNFANFEELDGLTVGGAQVSVVNGFGNDQGRLELTGIITSFSVGGQELWIDEVCWEDLYVLYLPLVFKIENSDL